MHTTFMRHSRAYQKAISEGNLDKARRALVRLMDVTIRQHKCVKGSPKLELLSSARSFGWQGLVNGRKMAIKAGSMKDQPFSEEGNRQMFSRQR
jgi:hypothetical protein